MSAQVWVVNQAISLAKKVLPSPEFQHCVSVRTIDNHLLSVMSGEVDPSLLGSLGDDFVIGQIRSYRNESDRARDNPGIPIVVTRNGGRNIHFSPKSEFFIRYVEHKKPRSDITGELTIRLLNLLPDAAYSSQQSFVASVFSTYQIPTVWPTVVPRPNSGFGKVQYRPLLLFETAQTAYRWNGAKTRPYT